ncbi:MAG: AAA family ATPase, partial [Pseudomonadota bacterium]
MDEIPGYQRLTILHMDDRIVVYRGEDEAGEPFILKQYQTPDHRGIASRHIDRLMRIDSPRLCTPIKRIDHDTSPVLVYPDIGGETLASQLDGDRSFVACIDIALSVTAALSDLHAVGLAHGQLNPDHIVMNRDTQALQLIGLSHVRPMPVPAYDADIATETPSAHTAPEQTGIISRGIDFRADYYALGATLFQLCTHQLPFATGHTPRSSEVSSLTPTPPNAHRKDLPASLNDIIVKLLAPYPEDRYLGLVAIISDLSRCRELLVAGDNAPFEIALDDVSEQFILSEKLRERHREIATIEERLMYLHTSASSLIAFAGGIGTGKSSLLRELHRFAIQQNAVVITGQHESTSVDMPYHGIAAAYRDLIGHILTLADATTIANEIASELGDHVSIVLQMLPQLEVLLGPSATIQTIPDARHIAVHDSKPVLAEALICITRAFCRHKPLVLTLEDMQWADFATLELIELLLNADPVPGLMIACTYRTNEASERPETKTWLSHFMIRNPGVTVVSLRNLALDSVRDLLNDSIAQSDDEISELATLVFEKTAGNPLAIREFVYELLRHQLLRFSDRHHEWQWDIDKIQSLPSPSDVSEFLTTRLDALDKETVRLLLIAACCGHSFSAEVLAEFVGLSIERCVELLNDAEDLALIRPVVGARSVYRFCHDTIRLNFYQRLPVVERRAYHAKIGLAILGSQESGSYEDTQDVFSVVSQLNNAVDHHDTRHIKPTELARLNLAAARRAMSAAAFHTAHRYLWNAIVILGKDPWTDYDLALEVHLTAARVAYLCGTGSKVDFILDRARSHARSEEDLVAINEITLLAHISEQRLDAAQAVALESLAILNVSIPQTTSEMRGFASLFWRILTMRVDRYRQLPEARDDRVLTIMRILYALTQIGYLKGDPATAGYVTTILDLSLRHGRSVATQYALSITGTLAIANLGLINKGYEISHALPGHLDFRAGAIQDIFVEHWKKPLRDTVGSISHSAAMAQRNGDLEFAGFAAVMSCVHAFLLGSDLNLIEANISKINQHSTDHNQTPMNEIGRVWQQTIVLLRKPATTPWVISGTIFDEMDFRSRMGNTQPATLAHLNFAKLMIEVMFERSSAAGTAKRLRPLLRAINGSVLFAQFRFLDSLATCLALENDAPKPRRPKLKIWAHLQSLRRWAQHNPTNFAAQRLIVEADYAALSGKAARAIQTMERAIETATVHQRPIELAIAYQRMARLYLSENRSDLAQFHLQRARACFLRWGAMSRVSMLDAESGGWPDYHDATTEYGLAGRADFNALLKATQYLAGEIVLPNLLRQTMELALEQTGASRASLLLQQERGLSVEITTRPDGQRFTHALLSQSLDVAEDLPASIVQFVARTREVLILNNVSEEGSFVRDAYVIATQPKSILCLPIQSKSYLTGVIYLENKLTSLAFSHERVSMLQILLSQAAIAIENGKLYQQLNDSRDKYLSLYKNSAAGVFELSDSRLINVNPAAAEFLGFESPAHVIDAGLEIQDIVIHQRDIDVIESALNQGQPVVGYEMQVETTARTVTYNSSSPIADSVKELHTVFVFTCKGKYGPK